jgi:hypothetical protein
VNEVQRAALQSQIRGLLNDRDNLLAEIKRLRAIEAAAQDYCDLTPDRADETPAPLLFTRLQAALAEKEEA